MNKSTVYKLFLSAITIQQAFAQSSSERDQIALKHTEVINELKELKMQAFDIPGFSQSTATLSVEEIMEKSK